MAAMFGHLRQFRKILVTGPHRAGTTYAASCIASDTGHEFRPEERIRFDCRYLMGLHLADERPFVIQCPFMAPFIHEYPQALVVWIRRDPEAIRASRGRMYGRRGFKTRPEPLIGEMLRRYHASGDLCKIQEENWQIQKARLPHWLELEYDSLRARPDFIDKRANFHVRQIAPGQDIERKPPLDFEPTIEIR